MTRRSRPALLLGIALTAGSAGASIDQVETCTVWADKAPLLTRAAHNDVTVTGFGVDLATSVTTTLPGTPVTVVSRKNGLGSNIVLRFAPPAVGNAAEGTVTLHYFGGGTDVFNASLQAGPSVTSISFASEGGVSKSGGATRVTSLDPHVVVLKGTNLQEVRIDDRAFFRSSLSNAKIVLQLPDELRVSFTSTAGDRDVGSRHFIAPGFCFNLMPEFSIAFTVFDPPRTPTPTPTATQTRTPAPSPTPTKPPFGPIAPPTGVRPALPTPTPTPRATPLSPIAPRK
ncbi:MAG TPA: hypothetical protein PLB01_10970 [Thermoanaerobaculia bacterium]|nr:hypothetical protein [Thermoanaerobaculia bacterium]